MREKRRGEVLRRVDMVMEGKFEETSVEAAAILLLFSLTSRKLLGLISRTLFSERERGVRDGLRERNAGCVLHGCCDSNMEKFLGAERVPRSNSPFALHPSRPKMFWMVQI